MTESNQLTQELHEDLRFVRNAVEAKERSQHTSTAPLVVWSLYSLICIPAYDFLPRYGGRINLVGWVTAMLVTFVMGKHSARRTGQFDREMIHRVYLHWFGGIALMFIAVYGLAFGVSGINGVGAGQLCVIIVGFLYFTAGIHLPESRFMRWAGPVIVVAGIGIGWLPHLRWTAMGLVFAVCLMSPIVFGGRKSRSATAA